MLRAGDYIDFWRIENVMPGESLLLRAEMKLLGRAWLQFALLPAASPGTLLRCCAWFEPRGIAGEIYWWLLYPIHVLISQGLGEGDPEPVGTQLSCTEPDLIRQ
jgi:hypothetical protein